MSSLASILIFVAGLSRKNAATNGGVAGQEARSTRDSERFLENKVVIQLASLTVFASAWIGYNS